MQTKADSKKKLAFLFGAGAEKNFKLPTGFEYFKQTILLSDDGENVSAKEMKEAIHSFFGNKYFKQNDFEMSSSQKKFYEHSGNFLRDENLMKRLYAEYVFDKKKSR